MGLLDVFFRPDLEEQSEKSEIVDAANLLQIGEFQLLQLAYEEWHGRPLPADQVDTLFSDYMLRQHVPAWARHYARNILRGHDFGRLNINDPAFHKYDRNYVTHVPQGVRRFWTAAFWCSGLVLAAVFVATFMTKEPTSLLPPYFDRSELAQQPHDPQYPD